MAGTRLTQLSPMGIPWERYGAFAGKTPPVTPPDVFPGHGGQVLERRRPLLRFTHIAKGGLDVDGRARISVGTVRLSNGGLALDGQAASSAGLAWITEGGLEADGAVELAAGHVHLALGGLQLAAEAAYMMGLGWYMAGGLELDGAAESEGASPYRARLPQLRRDDEELFDLL